MAEAQTQKASWGKASGEEVSPDKALHHFCNENGAFCAFEYTFIQSRI